MDNLQLLILPSKARSSFLAQEIDLDVYDNELIQGSKNNQKVLNEFSNLTTK